MGLSRPATGRSRGGASSPQLRVKYFFLIQIGSPYLQTHKLLYGLTYCNYRSQISFPLR